MQPDVSTSTAVLTLPFSRLRELPNGYRPDKRQMQYGDRIWAIRCACKKSVKKVQHSKATLPVNRPVGTNIPTESLGACYSPSIGKLDEKLCETKNEKD